MGNKRKLQINNQKIGSSVAILKNLPIAEDVTEEVNIQTPLITEILESLVGKATIANATPETILEGYSAYVGQQLVEGTMQTIAEELGYTEVTCGSITPTETNSVMSIPHNLSKIPKLVIAINTDLSKKGKVGYMLYQEGQSNYQGDTEFAYGTNIPSSSTQSYYLGSIEEKSLSNLKVNFSSYIYFSISKYLWIALA